jgi:hypothetical protein
VGKKMSPQMMMNYPVLKCYNINEIIPKLPHMSRKKNLSLQPIIPVFIGVL